MHMHVWHASINLMLVSLLLICSFTSATSNRREFGETPLISTFDWLSFPAKLGRQRVGFLAVGAGHHPCSFNFFS